MGKVEAKTIQILENLRNFAHRIFCNGTNQMSYQSIIYARRNILPKWSPFFILSFFLLLLISPDSPLMHPFGCRCDSSWFFTAGKAWMEGMTPYVDFADSKGPLLWLIYGMGYLLSPTSYLGIFWLSVIAYTVTFAFVWKTTRLFVGKREAFLVMAWMSALFFFRIYHSEVRAEDFCMPWICISLYFACKALLMPSPKDMRRGGWWIGVSLICSLLIKWNYFFMLGGGGNSHCHGCVV